MVVHNRFNILNRLIKSAGLVHLLRQAWRRYVYKLRGLPLVLQIEPTEACNLRCPYCVASQGILKDRRKLSLEEFQQIIDEVSSVKNYYPNLQLFWRGEPFVNSEVCDMVKYASDKEG